MLCANAPNLSIWAFLPALLQSLAGAFGRAARAELTLERKVYVAFQTNEGDTPKIVTGLFGGSWLNPRRGSAPVAWGVNLVLAREFPALMEFFASTATANDTFFGATSGAGYAFPSEMPPAAFARYAKLAGQVARDYATPPSGPADWVVDLWNWGVGSQQLH